MIIGITGSSGVLGSAIIKFLKSYKFKKFYGDISVKKDIDNWLKNNKLDALIHLAAIVPIVKVNKCKKKAKIVNYNGTKNLIDCLNKNYQNKKIWFFYASTSHVYHYSNKKINEKKRTNPINFYGKTKLMGENYIKKKGNKINYCIGRIFSFTSKNQNKSFFIPKMIRKFKSNKKKLYFENINHYRDFLIIDDIVKAIKILLINKARGTYNICSSKRINLVKLIKTINLKNNKELIFSKNHNQTILIGDNKKLKKLHWKPTNINYYNYLNKIF